MLRDKNLVPLSHQHQHALALCVRIGRAQPIEDRDLDDWRSEVAQMFQTEISVHFAAEEELVFPAALRFPELTNLIEELKAEHTILRETLAQAEGHNLSAEGLRILGEKLSAHIRKEERTLFESLQRLMDPRDLQIMGEKLSHALAAAPQLCVARPKRRK